MRCGSVDSLLHYLLCALDNMELYIFLIGYGVSWGSSVTTLTGLWAEKPGFDAQQGRGIVFICLHQRVQTDSGPHPASYPMGTRGSFPRDKADEACT